MNCSEHSRPPSLTTIRFDKIHLEILDPATGTPGVLLSWSPPQDGKVSYYDVYRSFKLDSLGNSVLTIPATDSPTALLPLPDSSLPQTIYFAVRSIWVEATGQKLISDTLAVDSISIMPTLSILAPKSGSRQPGRVLHIELETGSNFGVVLSMSLYEKWGSKWLLKQASCLPASECDIPFFGPAFPRDSMILEEIPPGDTVSALLCVVGTESFEGHLTGLIQSQGCSRFQRVGL
jgi:hypothetical protein